MRRAFLISLALGAQFAFAQALTLEQYLEEVKSKGPEGRALVEAVEAAELRMGEADLPLTPEFYGEYNLFDSRNEPSMPVQPSRTKSLSWRAGVRDQTLWGLGANLYLENVHTNMQGVNPAFFPLRDYYDTKLGLELRQSLWRNAFGKAIRAEYDMNKANLRMESLRQKFELKNLLLRAENTYWSLVSSNQIIKLQQENVDRAKRLRDWMNKRANMRLVDDVDALQAQASLETRELELMSSIDERAALMRQFNTLRGVDQDEVGDLAELPTGRMLLKQVRDPSKRMTREDFAIVFEQANAARAMATGGSSRVSPQLDLVGSISSNGLDQIDGRYSPSMDETMRLQNPEWAVGVVFSVPLDYGLLRDLRKGYRAAKRAADAREEQAKFNEQRTWDDLLKQNADAQRRFEKASLLEQTQTKLVQRERQRLLNGRSTTLQMITFEQNLALAQIQRVRAQLALLQIHNLLKTFEAAL